MTYTTTQNCQDKFDEIASQPNFSFVGNVSIGIPGHSSEHCTIELQNLMRHYDAVLFAYGASEDKKLGIPGESTLSNIHSAREVVGWYNGLPGCSGLNIDLTQAEEAVVIGQGNVALDVARMLLEDIDVLRKTDITEKALEALSRSRIKRVHVVGRRGPMQVWSFITNKPVCDINNNCLGFIHHQGSTRTDESQRSRILAS